MMNCPIDGTKLLITHRQNVEIDYCPACNGVWLDRGELDKVIEHTLEDQLLTHNGQVYPELNHISIEDFRTVKREKARRKFRFEDS